MLDEKSAKHLSTVPLSNDTVSRRIHDLASYVKQELVTRLQKTRFALQMDESTDVAGLAILLVIKKQVARSGSIPLIDWSQYDTSPGSFEKCSLMTAALTQIGFYILMFLGFLNRLLFTPNVATEKNRKKVGVVACDGRREVRFPGWLRTEKERLSSLKTYSFLIYITTPARGAALGCRAVTSTAACVCGTTKGRGALAQVVPGEAALIRAA
ncbi:Zinc finger BED domain-containing protein 5 [Eumeta japonica]|uniref:Zinc finger BED domain-containing protein 5 n=1 Tax=Eumeta variegata TaxID=151549 RepID=A0A4C1WQB1_EUMVA|nr:Zinc finger BED domain-containing protein 5 [Eumeta japonica]